MDRARACCRSRSLYGADFTFHDLKHLTGADRAFRRSLFFAHNEHSPSRPFAPRNCNTAYSLGRTILSALYSAAAQSHPVFREGGMQHQRRRLRRSFGHEAPTADTSRLSNTSAAPAKNAAEIATNTIVVRQSKPFTITEEKSAQ